MATLQQIFDSLQRTRDVSTESSPVATAISRLSVAMSGMRTGLNALGTNIEKQRISNMAAREAGRATDVQEQIRQLLTTKVASDNIEKERHQRMMDMAEEAIPQVTQEQIDAYKEQRKTYREQQRNLKSQLAIVEETAQVQKDAAKSVAEAQTAAISDKYGTLSKATGGLEALSQDALSKYLVQGLGRFIKGKQEAKTKEATVASEKRARDIEQEATWDKEDINTLHRERATAVASLARQGESVESGIASGGYGGQAKGKKNNKPPNPPPVADAVLEGASPALKKAMSGEWVGVATATPVEPKVPPKNASFKRADVQPTAPLTPNKNRNTVATGAFGGKGGFLNIGGIAKSISSLAGSAIKFLGPWGFIANSLMSFDRLVPIVSDIAGAVMDVSKIVMPLVVSSMIEGFNSIVAVINGIKAALDNSPFGKKFLQRYDVAQAQTDAFAAEQKRQDELDKARKNNKADKTSKVVRNITSAPKGVDVGEIATTRNEGVLTDTATESRISREAAIGGQGNNTGRDEAQRAYERARAEHDEALRRTVAEASRNPGTTPVWSQNPSLATWPV